MKMRTSQLGNRLVAVAGVTLLGAGLAACGGSTSSGASTAAGGGLPASVKILSIREMTGPVAFAGINAQKGIDLAVEQIEQQKFLGATKLVIDSKDSSNNTQEAVSAATQALADKSYTAILGPATSAQSSAISPIVQKSKMPTVYVQSGSDGIVLGDYTFRATAPADSYYDLAGQYLADKKIATAAVVYNSGNPTLVQLGQKTVPGFADKYGFKVTSSDGVQTTAQDFTANASQIAKSAPGAVFSLLTGPQNPVLINQLRQDGYKGEIIGMTSMGAGNLKTAGQTAAGVVWPTDFTATQPGASTQNFVKAYEAKFSGEVPNNYAAEAYDATWFIARALKEAGSADRTAVQKGLATVATQGFEGGQGTLTFNGTDLRVKGVLAQWNGTGETAVGK